MNTAQNYTEISARLIVRMDSTRDTWFAMCVRWFREAEIPVENDMLLGHAAKVPTSDEEILSVLPNQELNGFTTELTIVWIQQKVIGDFILERGYLTKDDTEEFMPVLLHEIFSKGVDWAGLAVFAFSSETGLSFKNFSKIIASYITGGKVSDDALIRAFELLENGAAALAGLTQIDTAIAFGDSSYAMELINKFKNI